MVENFYRPLVSVPEKESHAKLLRLKINAQTTFFKLEGETVHRATAEDITSHCRLIPVVEPSFLWFVANTFGMSFKVSSVLITAPGGDEGGAATAAGGDFNFGGGTMDTSQ